MRSLDMLPSSIAPRAFVGAVATTLLFSSSAALGGKPSGHSKAPLRRAFAGVEYERTDEGWTRRDAGVAWAVRSDRCTLRLRDDATVSIDELLDFVTNGAGTWTVGRRNRLGFVDITLDGAYPIEVCARLSDHPDVHSATPATLGRWMDAGDPYFSYQWHLNNTGQESQGTPGADIDVMGAWSVERGDPNVTIAFLDSKVMWSHPELVDAYAANSGEIPGNGIDDDDNGFIDDIQGWDFASDSPEVGSDSLDASHGTWVAGIAVARVGNGVGVAGVAGGAFSTPGCRAIQVVIGEEGPDASLIDDAILYAIDRGARVLSLTFAVPADPALLAAVDEAAARGVVMVAPSGNMLPEVPFPANHPRVIAVGGTNRYDAHWGIATAGPPVEISAPAYMIRTVDTAWDLWTASGTSYAVPQVAAAAALVLSWADCLDGQDVRAILRETATDIDEPGWDPRTGWGRLDVAAAVGRVARMVMPACRCREDLDGDGEVNGVDLGMLLAAWGDDDPLADLHADGIVDGIDLGSWLLSQGVCR
jgi:subtilisin family serine protease